EPERGAHSDPAVYADPSSHGVDQAFADRQSEAGPAKPPRGGRVRLGKRLKQAGLHFRRDADSAIADLYPDIEQAAFRGLRVDREPDLSCFGELEGVGEQIQQYLAKASRVAQDGRRRTFGDGGG